MIVIITHIIVALLSIACTTLGYARPTHKNLQASYVLAGLTFATGFYMVLSEPVSMLRACLSGVAYLTIVMAGIALTRRKLALLSSKQEA